MAWDVQVEAMRNEAAASAQAIEAEKAAGRAAKAEADALQRLLNEANSELQKQNDFTQRLGAETAGVKDELQAALSSALDLATDKEGLAQAGVAFHAKHTWSM